MFNVGYSTKNGLGRPSISVYFSGCDKEIKCAECHNSELWPKLEKRVSIETILELIDSYGKIHKNLIISLLGGEPLAVYNRKEVKKLTKILKDKYPQYPIVIYSWRRKEEIKESWVEFIDYGVLGAYDKTKHNEGYLPASSNQEIWDFNKQVRKRPIKLDKQ